MTPREVVDWIDTMASNGRTRTQILEGLSVELRDDRRLANCGNILDSIYEMTNPQEVWWVYSFQSFHRTPQGGGHELQRVDPETGLRRLELFGGYAR